MLNKVHSVATIPHSPTTQITFSAVAGLTEKNSQMAALAVCYHQHAGKVVPSLCIYRAALHVCL